MSYEIPLEKLTFMAAADLRTKQYYAVKLDTAGKIVLAGDGESAIGVLQDTPNTGEVGSVMTLGVTFGKAGDAITAGSNVASDAAGKFVTAGGGDAVIGTALKTAANGDIFPILLSIKSSTGTTGISAGYTDVAFPVDLVNMDNVKICNDFLPGFTGQIEKIFFVTAKPTTDTATVNFTVTPSIDGIPCTGGVLTLDVGAAGTDPDTYGKVIAATAITDNNDFTASSAIDLTVNNTSNAFTDGQGIVYMRLKITA